MDHERLEVKIIQDQSQRINNLERLVAIYKEKDEAQELLIDRMTELLDIATEKVGQLEALLKDAGREDGAA